MYRLFCDTNFTRRNDDVVSSVRTTTDVTGAARHAHIRFIRAHGRPARANSVQIRPGTRKNGHRQDHTAHVLHRPPVTRDTTRPLRAITVSLAATTRRTDRQGRPSTCDATIRAFGRAVMGGAHLASNSPPPHVDLELQSSRRGVRRGCRPPRTPSPSALQAQRPSEPSTSQPFRAANSST